MMKTSSEDNVERLIMYGYRFPSDDIKQSKSVKKFVLPENDSGIIPTHFAVDGDIVCVSWISLIVYFRVCKNQISETLH